MQTAFSEAIVSQFRGRITYWVVAFAFGSIATAAHFFLRRPTCDLMFYPAQVLEDYVIAWICLVVFIGITRRAKLVFALGVLVWLGTRPLVDYRIPGNEYRTVLWLNQMQRTLRSAKTPARGLSEIIAPELAKSQTLSGYRYEYSPVVQDGVLKRYVIAARPQCFCLTGQRSFALDDSGGIHYTFENRDATLSDPVLRRD